MALGLQLITAGPALADHGAYQVRNLVSDVPGAAEHTDPNLVNGWGIAFNPFGFVWVADNETGVSTLYDGDGNPQSLVVTIPGGKPTGIVFNGSGDFVVTKNGVSGPARFLFATENGTIAAWAPNVDPTNAITVVDNSESGAIYKGLAIGADGARFLLYAADFHNSRIDVFGPNFSRPTSSSSPRARPTKSTDSTAASPPCPDRIPIVRTVGGVPSAAWTAAGRVGRPRAGSAVAGSLPVSVVEP